jgi:ectoine hydroxylase-related dioxygenase (phytanoyl-CoA dioxygenase family)
MVNTSTEQQRQHFNSQGYVVVREAIDQRLVDELVAAVERILDRAMLGEFEAFRWIDQTRRIPDFMNDLLGPDKYDPVFGQLFDSITLPFIESLLRKPVRCSWLSLFPSGAGRPYSTPLHRDNNVMGGPQEQELLDRYRQQQCYFQVPLMPNDRFLQVIPGSHLRPASTAEIAAGEPGDDSEELPGLVTIEVQPGDVVYRHTDMLHRGWNPNGLARRTLISSLWAEGMPLLAIERQDHEALSTPGFLDRLAPGLKNSVERYLRAFELDEAGTAETQTC